MPKNEYSGPRRTRGPARRTSESVADLSRLNRELPIGSRDKRRVLRTIIAMNNDRHAKREKKVSYKTMQEREGELWLFFNALWDTERFATVDPRTLKPKHVVEVLQTWRAAGLSAKTLLNRLSSLRTYAFWIGKTGLIETAQNEGLDLSELKATEVATEDKSWLAHSVDIKAKITEAEEYCPYVAASLHLASEFALRLKEATMVLPHEGVIPIEDVTQPADRPVGTRYVLRIRGAKGNRPREIPIVTDNQWAAIRHAQAVVSPGYPMGRPNRSLKANLQWAYRIFAKIGITKKQLGVTAHGVRHQRLNEEFQCVAGVPSPVRGGGPISCELSTLARRSVVRLAGHSRLQIASAYCGKPRVSPSASPRQSERKSPTGASLPEDP